ncbi:MAG: DUF362 domain-containing protein [Candidatus Thermoplasmatota archaeon]
MTKVSIVKCDDYNQEKVDRAVEESLKLIGGVESIINQKDKVLLKPNLSIPKEPEKGVTTHPAVLKALSKIMLNAGAEVTIGDSSAGAWKTSHSLRVCGIEDLCKELNVHIANFDEALPIKVSSSTAVILKSFYMAQAVNDADVVVSVPKLKVHELMLFTGAVKNMFGAIPGWYKMEIHKQASSCEQFSNALIDIYSAIRPKLAVMDGIITVEGSAGIGRTKKVGVILASKDCLALDTVASQLIGYAPKTLPLNKVAKKRGFNSAELARIEIVGESLEEVLVSDFKKPQMFIQFLASTTRIYGALAVKPKMKLNMKKCIKCGLCRESCPVGAITMIPQPIFDFSNCIYCFCCREICPQGAIEIKLPWIARRIGKALVSE